MTPPEKEEVVIELYKQDKSMRDIAKQVHMSFSRIGNIIKRFEGIDSKEKKPLSKETQAMKLFKKGKDLVYVVTKLDMKPEDVKKIYSDFMDLQGLYSLTDIHNNLGNSAPSFVHAYEKIMQNGIGIDKIIRIAEILDEIPQIEDQYKEKSEIIQGMIQQVAALQKYVNSLNFESENKRYEIQNLNYEIERLKIVIDQIKKGEMPDD